MLCIKNGRFAAQHLDEVAFLCSFAAFCFEAASKL
jgi:hypothetical protein